MAQDIGSSHSADEPGELMDVPIAQRGAERPKRVTVNLAARENGPLDGGCHRLGI